jgi:leader peptidase (prepilin peptidase)/N-methyltransferase|tara:strand:- start:421 stop:1185 length:765 start_codon:yes stop_codon:yes gene_type:complete
VHYLAFIVFGSLWGSFANVCIYRLPENKGVVRGRSSCPKCKNSIKWFDNIPLISFILLKGKCRNCNNPIALQYFIVELIGSISFVAIYHFFGVTLTTLLLLILSVIFIIIFFIDLKHFIIPNVLTFTLMIVGFIKSFDPNLNKAIFPNYINSLIGGVFGYLIIWLIIYFYKKVRKKEGMGLGDAKLLSAIGFWFGWLSIPFTIFISSLVALILVIPSILNKSRGMTSQIPFGPYIIIGCIIYVSFANQIKNILF